MCKWFLPFQAKFIKQKILLLFDRLFYPQLSSNEDTAMTVYTNVKKSESCSSATSVSSSFTVTQSLQNMLLFFTSYSASTHIFSSLETFLDCFIALLHPFFPVHS